MVGIATFAVDNYGVWGVGLVAKGWKMNRLIGTIGLFLLVSVCWWWTQQTDEGLANHVFNFEKHDVTGFLVEYPDRESLKVLEKDGEWIVSKTGHTASMTMVNRVRHQIHNLSVRAHVTEHSSDLTLYGLGPKSTTVTIYTRQGEETFEVGAPNPTGVSYYIRPLTGPLQGMVVTVAKAAVDYYAAPRSEFRSPHFCRFDLDSVSQIDVVPVDGI